jgi:hypothetical protein
MPADQTATVTVPNVVLTQLALTTTAKQYDFTIDPAAPPVRSVALTCDVAFYWSHSASGPWAPVGASPNGYEFDFPRGTTSVFVKTQSGTGTLTPIVTR